jgi:thiamine-phosphate pyrophosphorylase
MFMSALGTLKPARIAGCAGLASRHDAMTAAEQGADYVMFGDVQGGHRPSFEAIVERITWWAEVFEVPCVAMAESLDEVGPLAAAGADFVAVGDFVWNDPRGVAAALAAVAARLSVPESVV